MSSEGPKPARSASKLAPSRVIVEGVHPEVDGGRFPIKRTVGEEVVVTADIFVDGHDALAAVLKHRAAGASVWVETPMTFLVNDRWTGHFAVTNLGRYEYTVEAWVDRFASWHKELTKKAEAGQDVASELLEGAEHVREGSARASGPDSDWLRDRSEFLARAGDQAPRVAAALDPNLATVMARYPDRTRSRSYDRILGIMVERERARYGAWYELFPRSCAPEPGRHGTFKDTEARLPYVASMGFDVLYLPPIHPIGRAYRKGRTTR